MNKSIRNSAEALKATLGTCLGLYETIQPISDTIQQKTILVTLIGAAKTAGFLSGLVVSTTDAQLVDFVLSVGPTLQALAPVQ